MKVYKLPKLSIQEYQQQELDTGLKHEFIDGVICALAGGTINHGRLCGNIYTELRKQLGEIDSKCEAFNSEIKLHIEKKNAFVYPDAMVICGNTLISEEDEHAVVNPVLVAEVLSKSTSNYDRGEKFYLYRQIPSLEEYIIIEQSVQVVEVYYKKPGNDLWRITRYDESNPNVELKSLGIVVSIEDIYANINLESA